MHVSAAEPYRAALERVLGEHSTKPCALVFTSNIARWASENHVSVSGDPPATSVPSVGSEPPRVVLLSAFTEDQVNGILGGLDLSGFSTKRRLLASATAFLKHLVLHELAHLENGWGQEQERECDAWAFERSCEDVA